MNDLINHIKENCTPIDREFRYDQMLDDCYDFKDVGGPFAHMVPSQVLKEMDPTAYRCGVNDYMDGEDTYEIDYETYDRNEVENARQEFIDGLESDLDQLQTELDEIEVEDARDLSLSEQEAEIERLRTEISALEERISEARSYEF